LALKAPCAPNVSQYSKEIETSRATVMNYIKYLKDARFFNLLYPQGEEFPKKPEKVYMHNTNLMYAVSANKVDEDDVRKTFFYNIVHTRHKINSSDCNADFLVDRQYNFKIEKKISDQKIDPSIYYVEHKLEIGTGKQIPLWLFGFLY
jgi:predicted AAA+ superfamily ATPase